MTDYDAEDFYANADRPAPALSVEQRRTMHAARIDAVEWQLGRLGKAQRRLARARLDTTKLDDKIKEVSATLAKLKKDGP